MPLDASMAWKKKVSPELRALSDELFSAIDSIPTQEEEHAKKVLELVQNPRIRLFIDIERKRSNDTFAETPLIDAIIRGYDEIAQILINAKANVNIQVNQNMTPLMYAMLYKRATIAQALLTAHADINAQNANGRTALHIAALSGFPDLVKLLIASHADLTIQDKQGETALHEAILANNYEIIALLVAAGAQFDVANKAGKTPQDYINSKPSKNRKKINEAIARSKEEMRKKLASHASSAERVNNLTITVDKPVAN